MKVNRRKTEYMCVNYRQERHSENEMRRGGENANITWIHGYAI